MLKNMYWLADLKAVYEFIVSTVIPRARAVEITIKKVE